MESIFESHLEVDDEVWSARGCSSEECDSFVSDDISCAGDMLAQNFSLCVETYDYV